MSFPCSGSIVPRTGWLRKLYEDASTRGMEHTSATFWRSMLQTHLNSTNSNMITVSEVHRESILKDYHVFVMKHLLALYTTTRPVLIVSKRPGQNPSTTENQAKQYAYVSLKDETLKKVYIITTCGIRFRVWEYFRMRDGAIRGRCRDGRGEAGNPDAYIDADTIEGNRFLDIMTVIMRNLASADVSMPPSRSTSPLYQFSSPISPRQSSPSLYLHRPLPDDDLQRQMDMLNLKTVRPAKFYREEKMVHIRAKERKVRH